MKKKPSDVDVATAATRLTGRTSEDPELRAFLEAAGQWPIPKFPRDEYQVVRENKTAGYALQFDDAKSVKHPSAEGLRPRTALFTGAFFYSQGLDGFEQFGGSLPGGIEWGDTAETLVHKLGPAKATITKPKSSEVDALRWQIEDRMLEASFEKGGKLGHVYVGII